MMKSKVSAFLPVFNNVVGQNEKFRVFTRGIEFQKKAIDDLKLLQKKTVRLKEKMMEKKDEESSNILLSLENLLGAYIAEIETLISLKEDKMDKAWDSLVTAQMSLRTSLQANDIALSYDGNGYVNRLLLLEQLLFPKQVFMSMGGISEGSECSICSQQYGTCTHLKGKPYMGQICYEKITRYRAEEVSIVDEPGNKMCRVQGFSEGGSWRDVLTWRTTDATRKSDMSNK